MNQLLFGLSAIASIIFLIGIIIPNFVVFAGFAITAWAAYKWTNSRGRKVESKKRPFFLAGAFLLSFILIGCSETTKPTAPSPSESVEEDDVTEALPEKQAEIEQEKEKTTQVEKGEELQKEVPARGTESKQDQYTQAVVTRIIDGDSIEILLNGQTEKVRLLLIDTPETKHPNKPVEPFGPEASKFAENMLSGKEVGIQIGLEERDKYDRLLAYVWLEDRTFQEMILEAGFARTAYLYNDVTMLGTFHQAQAVAQQKGIGVWSIEGYAHADHDHGYHYQEEPIQEPISVPAPASAPAATKESFKNCTELRKVYPEGVEEDHPAYASKHDRDKDGYACETN